MALSHSGCFALRTPLLPFATLTTWGEGLAAPAARTPADLATAIEQDRVRLGAAYRALIDSPIVGDALFLASPDLVDALEHWFRDQDDDRGQAAERALTRYLTRMAARATPFGLFAATAPGTIAESTCLSVAPPAACRRQTRLDIACLERLAEVLERDRAVRDTLRYTPNTSLYRWAGAWRYVEARAHGPVRSYHLVALEPRDELDATIAAAEAGATRAELAAALVDGETTLDEADRYVGDLVDNQVLVPALACPVTGIEPLDAMCRELDATAGGTTAAAVLGTVARAIHELDSGSPAVDPARYRTIARQLDALAPPIGCDRLFHVDMIRPPGATLGPDVVSAIADAVALLHRLQPAPMDDDLDRFRAAFAERYGEREVPLAEALDDDAGLGGALTGGAGSSPLLGGLDFPEPARETIPWGRRERWLLDRIGRALADAEHEISLTGADLDALATPNPRPLPDALVAMATIIGGPDAETAGPRVLLHQAAGPSGACLLGRFCHADPELHQQVLRHLQAEEAFDPDAVYAEIVHLPEGRSGNVLLRPTLRSHEIVYLGRSGAPSDRQIRIDDLTLQLRADRFVLRSRRLGRRVVPRLTSAENFQRTSLPIYRLLCLLQSDGRMASCAWSWGPLGALPFLPRIRAGTVVLARARWHMTSADIAATEGGSITARYSAVQRWRRSRKLPRWVVVADDDQLLPVDLDNVLAVESFVHLLKGRDEATLTELYPGPAELAAHGPDGRYAHEVLVPFTVRSAVPAVVSPGTPAAAAPARRVVEPRTFPPGSSWIYAQLYGGAGVADRVLAEVVGPRSRALRADGQIAQWFFLRYPEPEMHLRWRLQVAAGTRPGTVQRQVAEAVRPLIENGLVRRLAFDTYEREVERYGGDEGVAIAERWFWADSEAVVDMVELLGREPGGAELRWRAALLGVDALLDDAGLDLPARHALVLAAREHRGLGAPGDAALRAQLARRFRAVQAELSASLDRGVQAGSALHRVTAPLVRRSRRSRGGVKRLNALARRGCLGRPVDELAASFAHLFLNRLLPSDHDRHEAVIYDYLVRLYAGRRARGAGRRV